MFCLFVGSANATLLDFTAMPDGSVSTIGDVTFSLAGIGDSGDPRISSEYGGGLWNFANGAVAYPSNTILRAEFDSPVSNVTFDFDNQGGKSTFWSIFDVSDVLIATGPLSTDFFDFTSYGNIKSIEWNNNGNNWLFKVKTLSYDSVTTASVPEPSVLALLGFGLVGIGFARKKKRA